MARSEFRIHAAGCGLGDILHSPLDFAAPSLAPYRSRTRGDGGLEMGRLVFLEDLERYSGRPWETILADLSGAFSRFRDANPGFRYAGGGAVEAGFNAGGPALAASVLAAQLLRKARIPVSFYGLTGDDTMASRIRHLVAQTPLDLSSYRQRPGRTPRTHVFTDPAAQEGHGDRFFVHDPGSADPHPDWVGESFFQATFNLYAGTALVPGLHRALPRLLEKGRRRGALNVVGTVFDFAAEKARPGSPWNLGGEEGAPSSQAYPHIDLLVGDREEFCRLAGLGDDASADVAVDTLLGQGLSAAVVTQGPGPIYYRSLGGAFGECRGFVPPPPELVEKTRDRLGNTGDTIGAGDNFLGALLSDLTLQILEDDFFPKAELHVERELLYMSPLRLSRAAAFGAVAGGLACLQNGGIRLEASPGERMEVMRAYLPEARPAGRPW